MPETRSRTKLRNLQRFKNQQAVYYRRGLNVRNDEVYNDIITHLGNVPHPILQYRRHMHHGFTHPRNSNIYMPLDIARLAGSAENIGGGDADSVHTRIVFNRMARQALRVGVRYRQMLSMGGMGVTSLFEVRNRQGRYNKCVVKIARAGGEYGLLCEKAVMQDLKGAPHIVQIQTAHEMRGLAHGYEEQEVNGVMPQAPPNRPSAAETHAFDRDPSILMMEFARMGTLAYWIDFWGNYNIPCPDHVLWQILSCLIKGGIAMAYPPKAQATNNLPNRPDPMAEYVPSSNELRRNRRRQKQANYVHFDLDPTNVLVDGFDDAEHNELPCLKLADFGLTQKVDDTFRHSIKHLWGCRMIGKFGYMTPEQWTAEWDLIENNPLLDQVEGQPFEIAGRYGSVTNVWQIGMIMLNCITQNGPEFPPYARRVKLPMVRENDILHHGHARRNRFLLSHGYILEDESFDGKLDQEMRNVVMACLAYKPDERPTLAELEQICNERIASGFPNRNAEWGHLIFSGVRIPAEPQPDVAYNAINDAIQEEFDVFDEDELGGELWEEEGDHGQYEMEPDDIQIFEDEQDEEEQNENDENQNIFGQEQDFDVFGDEGEEDDNAENDENAHPWN